MIEEEMFLKEINEIRAKFNKITSELENEEIPIHYAHFNVEPLLKRALILKQCLKHMGVDKSVYSEIVEVVDNLKQLSHDITDVIYIEHGIRF